MSENKWHFDFADVEITEDKIIVNSTIPYKKLHKEYKDLIDPTGTEVQDILEEVFEKKRVKDKTVYEPERSTLITLFNRMAAPEEEEAAYIPGERAYEPGSTTARSDLAYEEKSLYKIHIMEEVELVLEHDGTIEKSEIVGKIKVENQGKDDRIWDIDVDLENMENTDIEDEDSHIHLPKLETGADWDKEYKIKPELVKEPPLEIIENINTWTDTPEENTTLLLEKEHDVEFNIILENNSEGTILDIQMEKIFPDQFKDLKRISTEAGELDLEDDKAIWRINELRPKAQVTLKLGAKILPESTDPIPTGTINAKYFLTEGTFSGLGVKQADGFSKNVFTIEKDERDDQPDVWDCHFVFMNKSEFPFLLKHIDLVSGDINTEEEAVHFEPHVIVPPDGVWESETWDIESDDVPTFGKKVLFTLLPDVDEELKAKVTLKPMELYVLSFKGEKTYDRYEIPSYKSILVKAANEAWSEGPVDIETLVLEDVIPADFRPPTPEDVQFYLNDDKIDPQQYSIDISPSTDYDAEDYPQQHTLALNLENVPDLVEAGTELKVRLEYKMLSVKAKPETEYKGDCTFKAYPVQRGPEIEVALIPNPIEVTHVRRRETMTKSVYPGAAKDEYEISLTYINRGSHIRKQKLFVDQIPADFELISMEPEGKTKKAGDFVEITWNFKDIEPDQEVSVSYVIKGEGDYKAGQTELFTKD